MKYLLILMIFICGCRYPVEDTMVIHSVEIYDDKYFYTVEHELDKGSHKGFTSFVSSKKFNAGDKVQLTLKEN